MKFRPGSDLMPAGQYDAVVMSAVNKKSKNGADMIEMQIAVFDEDGNENGITDWLVDHPKMQYKIRHFCESAGFDYEKGELEPEQVMNANVRVNVDVQDDPKYGKQNRVKDYLPRATEVKARAVAGGTDEVDQEFGF